MEISGMNSFVITNRKGGRNSHPAKIAGEVKNPSMNIKPGRVKQTDPSSFMAYYVSRGTLQRKPCLLTAARRAFDNKGLLAYSILQPARPPLSQETRGFLAFLGK